MFWSLCNVNGPFSRGSWHTDKRAMDTVKQSPINNAFASDCLAPRMGLLKNRGHMFFSSGQPSLDATHTPTQCSAPWTHLCNRCKCNYQTTSDTKHIYTHTVNFHVTVYMHTEILMGIFVYAIHRYTCMQTHSKGACNLCVRMSVWRMAVEVTSLKSSHWWGPACDPGPLRHINHNPFLLAFIRPAESYCPAFTPTPSSLSTPLL